MRISLNYGKWAELFFHKFNYFRIDVTYSTMYSSCYSASSKVLTAQRMISIFIAWGSNFASSMKNFLINIYCDTIHKNVVSRNRP